MAFPRPIPVLTGRTSGLAILVDVEDKTGFADFAIMSIGCEQLRAFLALDMAKIIDLQDVKLIIAHN